MGAGGTTGAVSFPAFLEDVHGWLIGGEGVDTAGGSIWSSQNFTKPITDVMTLVNTGWSTNPYTGFEFTNPSTELAESKAQFDLFLAGVSDYGLDNYGDYITKSLLAVTQPTTGQIPDLEEEFGISAPSTLAFSIPTTPSISLPTSYAVALATSALSSPVNIFTPFSTFMKTEALAYVNGLGAAVKDDVGSIVGGAASFALGSVSLTAATTLWDGIMDKAKTKLEDCDIPKEVSLNAVLNQAASIAEDNVKSAIKLVAKFVNTGALSDVVTSYGNRRETTYQQQVSKYAGTMADLNAVNSSAFLFGVALLRSEQQREVSEFDSQVSLDMIKQGMDNFIRLYASNSANASEIALSNATAHNSLLTASVALLALLSQREEITSSDLLSVFGNAFNAEVGAFAQIARTGLNNMSQIYGAHLQDSFSREFEIDRLNISNFQSKLSKGELDLRAQLSIYERFRAQLDQARTNFDVTNAALNLKLGELEASRINKISKERRYEIGLQQTIGLLTNKVEYNRLATALLTDQNISKINARSQYEGLQIEDYEREAMWDLNIARVGAEIFAAPSGMAAAVPKMPHPALQVAGVAIQAAGAAASLGAGGK